MGTLILRHASLSKTLTYCVMHFMVAFCVAYVLSGNFIVALSIGTIEPLVQTFCYFWHERVWESAKEKGRSLSTPRLM